MIDGLNISFYIFATSDVVNEKLTVISKQFRFDEWPSLKAIKSSDASLDRHLSLLGILKQFRPREKIAPPKAKIHEKWIIVTKRFFKMLKCVLILCLTFKKRIEIVLS
jgi:hypothetical protein